MGLFDVRRALGAGFGNNSSPPVALTTFGQLVTVDWYTAMLMDGRGYQVRIGAISAPVTGDGTRITDLAAEMAVDAASGTTIFPCEMHLAIDAYTADEGEHALNSVGVVSSAGTAFTPLPLKADGAASVSTARAQATGNVTVTSDVVTTTVEHSRSSAIGSGVTEADTLIPPKVQVWRPIGKPPLVGATALYLQVAIWTYYARIDYIEVPTLMVNPS